MRVSARAIALAVSLAALALPNGAALADPNPPVSSFTWSANMEPLGASLRPNPSSGIFNSDLAFWGNRAYQGTYDGFRIIDISDPSDPQSLLDYAGCSGASNSNQGDVIVWDRILVRSWNSANSSATTMCDGEPVPVGFEGLHVFDVSNPLDPDLVASVNLPSCGSHTATGVPDTANSRLLVYNGASSASCPIQIAEVPFANPALTSLLPVPTSAGRSCHDISAILGDAMLLTCAGGNGFTVFSLGGSRGGSLTMPLMLYSNTVTGVTIGHSSSYSWDGRTLVFGHEPGGGSGARCQASSATVDKTLFFYDADTGTEVGRWVLPRPQSSTENCTIHNFNVVPSDRRNVLVSGSYQSGIGVVEFTDRTAPVEIAYADPAPLTPTQLGGDWSSYWYDGTIYEGDITRGLLTWRLNDRAVTGARTLGHLNPQTQEFTIPFVGEPALADLSITKDDAPDPAEVNGVISYTLTVSNGGPEDATGVMVTDPLPASVEFSSAVGSQGACFHDGSPLGGTVTCDLGDIANGATASVALTVTPRQQGTIENTASVTSDAEDLVPANDSDTETTTVGPESGTPSKVTGGGRVAGAGGGSASFGFNAQEKNGKSKGNVNVLDHGTGQHVKSVSVTDVRLLTGGEVRVRGTCSVDGAAAEPCEVVAFDRGQPGTLDEFRITVGATYSAGGLLQSGNIKIH